MASGGRGQGRAEKREREREEDEGLYREMREGKSGKGSQGRDRARAC